MPRPARYDFQTRPVAHPEAIVAGDKYRFTILTDGLLRFEWAEDGRFEDRASTFAINRKLAVPDFYVWDRGHGIEIVTKRFHVLYNKKKFSSEGFHINLKGAVAGKWSYGQQVSNLGGTTRTLDTIDGRCRVENGILSRDGFAVLDDSNTMMFESNGWIGPRRSGERSDQYIFLYGHDYRDALRAYYAVSGSQPLLPRFALGNWWSRYHRFDREEYLKLMDHFDRDDVPLNVATIDMDWHLVNIPGEYGSGWTGYTWNKDLFPNPESFLEELRDRDLKVTLNVHPADGIRAFEDQYEKVAKYLKINPKTKAPINFDCTSKEFMDAYFDIVHHEHEAQGVDFWWIDWQQGDKSRIPGVDPLWVLNHFHFLDIGRGSQRPLILSRFGGPGSQRYQIGFSGDTHMTWDSLHFQPEFTATSSNIGYGWWSHDIGGHMHGFKDDELTARWVQLGCFSPILRLHSSNNIFNTREPWTFGPEACKVMEDTLRLRHRLIPYLYTMNARSASFDEPLIVPMYWDYPEVDEAYKVNNQFRFGSELIVAPITQRRSGSTHLGSVKGWLPNQRFVDIFTGTVYDGDRELTFHRKLSGYPVLAPEGAIVPLDAAYRCKNGSPNPEAFEVLVVVGADGSFNLVEDNGTGTHVDESDFCMIDADGHESASDNVRFIYTPITYKQNTGTIKIGPTSTSDPSIPKSRDWKIRLISHTPQNHAEIRCVMTSSKKAKPINYTAKAVENGTMITLGSVPTDQTCIIELSSSPQLDVLDPKKPIWPILWDTDMMYDRKWDAWGVIESGQPLSTKVGRLQNMGLGDDLLGAILEHLLADSRYGSS
ncbi:glycoside hydrolase family 31 protein [Aaosphaeria arxii CBS 175.79]|uniref:alpha-glucosidase n=1 Tax=Aaosphaeria arxii CBS 175.79 TaxID=1450172 RepID=A0A6A5XHS7_9PLEO|nr:glycoside hydrolase family 31 protein [Aaosphaeria arxii CBS 175.79]KAF2012672.1 glycoside hydrolase family 31 protein [Aaosphaeria arxii CBS 175.79]